MKELKELIGILSKQKLKGNDAAMRLFKTDNMMQQLYDGIRSGKFEDDQDAAMALYGADPGYPSYKKLKYRLEKRLINNLFNIDVNAASFSDLDRAYYNSYKQFAAVKILLGRLARNAAMALSEKLIIQARKFEFTTLVLELATQLRYHYGSIMGDMKRFEYYNDMVKQYEVIQHAEFLASEYYVRLSSHYVNSRGNKPELVSEAVGYYNELVAYGEEKRSRNFNIYFFNIAVLRFEIANDYINTIRECDEAIAEFSSQSHVHKNSIVNFKLKKLWAYIQLRNYAEGEKTGRECLWDIQEGTSYWYLTLELLIILAFHSEQYQRAYEIYTTASSQGNFDTLSNTFSENWRIYAAYINYFKLIGKIESDTPVTNFKLRKFVNDVPIYSKDKRGMNIAILIIQILYMLHQKKYEEVLDRVSAMKQYCFRYLRDDDTLRSNCFVHMLLNLSKEKFDKRRAMIGAKKYLDKMIAASNEISNQPDTIEIVPYERLWELILESLGSASKRKLALHSERA